MAMSHEDKLDHQLDAEGAVIGSMLIDPEIVRDPERRQRPRLGKASLRAERGGAVGTNAG